MKFINKLFLSVVAMTLGMSPIGVKAQRTFNGGVEAGAVLSFPADQTNGKSIGWYAGVTGEYELGSNWLVEGALRLKSKPTPTDEFSGFGKEPEYMDYPSMSGATMAVYDVLRKTTPVYLELPIRVGYGVKLSNKLVLSISGGPYFGLGVFGKSKWSKITQISHPLALFKRQSEDFECNLFGKGDGINEGIMHRFDVGVSVKTELRFKGHYGLTLEYTRQLNPMFKHYRRMYNQTLSLGLLYVL